jgi:hypothetical protein
LKLPHRRIFWRYFVKDLKHKYASYASKLKQSILIAETETALQELQSILEADSQINEHVDTWIRGLSGGELSSGVPPRLWQLPNSRRLW